MEHCAELGVMKQPDGKPTCPQADAHDKAVAKVPGTGVFMPLTMRTVSSTGENDRSQHRSKPNRRRNFTSPSILPNCQTDREPARRSISSSNHATHHRNPPTTRNCYSSLIACMEAGDCAADYAPLADVAVAMNAAAGITASAYPDSNFSETTAAAAAAALLPQSTMSRAASSPLQASMAVQSSGTSGLNHPDQVRMNVPEQQPQHMLRQHTAPGQLPLLAGGSRVVSPRSSTTGSNCMPSDGSTADNITLLNARLDAAAAGTPRAGCTLPGRGNTPICSEAFFGPSALQPVEAGHASCSNCLAATNSDMGVTLPTPLSNGSSRQSSDIKAPAAVVLQPHSPGKAAASPKATAGTADGRTLHGSNIYSQLSFDNWTGQRLPNGCEGSNSFKGASAEVAPGAPEVDLEQHEHKIQKRIEELLVMKQLLKLKQQHKQQQMQLQLEQLRQEQELQQMLADMQYDTDGGPFEIQRSASSWSAGGAGSAASNGTPTMQVMQPMQQQLLRVHRSSNSLEHLQREALLQQLQQQQQQQAPAGVFSSKAGLVPQTQQDLLSQLNVERSQGSFGNTLNQELQQLQQMQQLQLQQQQLPMQHSSGAFHGANQTLLMLQPVMSAPAPLSDAMLGLGSQPASSDNGLLQGFSGLKGLNAQSFDAVLPMYSSTCGDAGVSIRPGNVGSGSSAACNRVLVASPVDGQLLALATLDDGRTGGNNMANISAVSGGVQSAAARWGTSTGHMGMNNTGGGGGGGGGMSPFQLF